MADQYVRDHQAWLCYLQPDGLVVSPAALVDSQVILPRDAREEQQRFLEFVAEAPIGDDQHVDAIADLTQFLETFLEWPTVLLYGANPARPLPETLSVPLSEFGEILSPTIASQIQNRSIRPSPGCCCGNRFPSAPIWMRKRATTRAAGRPRPRGASSGCCARRGCRSA